MLHAWLLTAVLGLATSHHLGEPRGGFWFVGSLQHHPWDIGLQFANVPKYTGEGYSLKAIADIAPPRARFLLLGLELSHRDGGDWAKQQLRARAGITLSPLAFIVRRDLKEWGGRNAAIALIVRVRHDFAGRIRLHLEAAAHRFHPTNRLDEPAQWGRTLDVGLGLTVRR